MGPLPPPLPPKFSGIKAPGLTPAEESPRIDPSLSQGEGPTSPPHPESVVGDEGGEGFDSLPALLDRLRRESRVCVEDDGFISRLLEAARSEASPFPTGKDQTSSGGGSSRGGNTAIPGAGGSSDIDPYLWYRRLLEAVTETLLGGDAIGKASSSSSSLPPPPPSSSYCALHRARLRAVHEAATFFCRIKPEKAAEGKGSGHLPEVCYGELRRRLKTYLLSLIHGGPSEVVDHQRREDLVMAFSLLKSPLSPWNIVLDSLLEFLCRDVLMSARLGEEVKSRLNGVVARVKSCHDHDLWQAAKGTMGSIWRMAMGGSNGNPSSDGVQGCSKESQLMSDVGMLVDELVQWLRQHARQLRLSNGTEEVLGMVDPGLRRILQRQEYRSSEQFFQVFRSLERHLSAIRIPPSHQTCGPRRRSGPMVAEVMVTRECQQYDMTSAQLDKDLSRERFVVDGVEVMGLSCKDSVRALLSQWGRRAARDEGTEVVVGEEVMERVLVAASRTVFGGDAYFLVNDLFGGEGVTITPTKDSCHHDAITFSISPPDASGSAGGSSPLLCRVVVKSSSLYSLFENVVIRQATEKGATPNVHLLAHITETLPIEAHRDSSTSPIYLTVGPGTTRVVQIQARASQGNASGACPADTRTAKAR